MRRCANLTALLALVATVMLSAAEERASTPNVPAATGILQSLRKEHPRLLASAKDFSELKQRIAADEQLKKWADKLREQARRILGEPPSKYEIPDGLRLLGTSRRVL